MASRTRLGTLLFAAGWACFGFALVFHTIAPAFLGVILVSIVLAARVPPLTVSAERKLPDKAFVDEDFEAVTIARGPANAPVFVEAPTPASATLRASRLAPGRGSATLSQTFRIASPGALLWSHAVVRVQDPWGIVESSVTVPIRDTINVLPSSLSLAEGSRLGRRTSFKKRSKKTAAASDEPEIELLRDYQPGDRLRDVDWAQTSKLRRLIVRQMRNEPLRPVVILIDASESMRFVKRGSKLATAVNCGLSLSAAARTGGVPVGMVAWSERGLEAHVRVGQTRAVLAESIAKLGALPPAAATVPAASASLPLEMVAPSPEEREFLAAASSFSPHARGATTPLEAALSTVSKASPQPSFVVAFLDVEHNPALAATVARRLRQRGHLPIIVALASGPHHYRRAEVDARTLPQLVRWRTNRERARAACQQHRAPFHVLGPRVGPAELKGVLRSFQ